MQSVNTIKLYHIYAFPSGVIISNERLYNRLGTFRYFFVMIFINCIFAFLTTPEIKKLLKFICKFFKTSHYWELFVDVFILGKSSWTGKVVEFYCLELVFLYTGPKTQTEICKNEDTIFLAIDNAGPG